MWRGNYYKTISDIKKDRRNLIAAGYFTEKMPCAILWETITSCGSLDFITAVRCTGIHQGSLFELQENDVTLFRRLEVCPQSIRNRLTESFEKERN